ncbi:MAG TPA: GNAT family N-acetyltransferase [Bacteroidales bacterium]|jgi:N-acetylglutamate synthase-like GNAT family acetyltransferase|nr:GNAT family N-acetyltransferase [Bacteroidales bacterium]
MEIFDLTPEFESKYFCCLEDWSEEVKEAGDHKACWYNKMKDKGLRVKLARNENGICGMIQYLPAEHSIFEGRDLYVIMCIWVHGHRQGVGNNQKKGIGKALLEAAETDVRQKGSKGIAAWGIVMPFFMRASWYKRHGYRTVDKSGIIRLLWKPFRNDAIPPSFIKQKKKPELTPGKVNVSLFMNGWCPAQNIVYERTKRAISGFDGRIEVHEYDTLDKNLQREWGISDGVFIDGKEIRNGPPTPYKKIRIIVEKKVKRMR